MGVVGAARLEDELHTGFAQVEVEALADVLDLDDVRARVRERIVRLPDLP